MHLWADDEEIVCIHPNCPRLIGHAEIRSSWEAIFELGKIQVQAQQIHIIQNMLHIRFIASLNDFLTTTRLATRFAYTRNEYLCKNSARLAYRQSSRFDCIWRAAYRHQKTQCITLNLKVTPFGWSAVIIQTIYPAKLLNYSCT